MLVGLFPDHTREELPQQPEVVVDGVDWGPSGLSGGGGALGSLRVNLGSPKSLTIGNTFGLTLQESRPCRRKTGAL